MYSLERILRGGIIAKEPVRVPELIVGLRERRIHCDRACEILHRTPVVLLAEVVDPEERESAFVLRKEPHGILPVRPLFGELAGPARLPAEDELPLPFRHLRCELHGLREIVKESACRSFRLRVVRCRESEVRIEREGLLEMRGSVLPLQIFEQVTPEQEFLSCLRRSCRDGDLVCGNRLQS